MEKGESLDDGGYHLVVHPIGSEHRVSITLSRNHAPDDVDADGELTVLSVEEIKEKRAPKEVEMPKGIDMPSSAVAVADAVKRSTPSATANILLLPPATMGLQATIVSSSSLPPIMYCPRRSARESSSTFVMSSRSGFKCYVVPGVRWRQRGSPSASRPISRISCRKAIARASRTIRVTYAAGQRTRRHQPFSTSFKG